MKNKKIPILLLVLFLISFFLDLPIRAFFRSIQNPYITDVMLFVSRATTVVFVLVFAALFFLIKKRKDILFYSIASVIASLIIVFLIKSIYFRPRPFEDLGISSIDGSLDSSFPSGHVTRMATLVPFVWIYKKFGAFILIVLILVAVSRIYLHAHYLSDVIFGFILGYYLSLFFLYLSRKNNKLNKFLAKI